MAWSSAHNPVGARFAMNSRRICRESALQALYLCDAVGDFSSQTARIFAEHFLEAGLHEDGEPSSPQGVDSFYNQLLDGVLTNLETIDTEIGLASTNWSVARMAPVERNILRVAVYELLYRSDIPSKVSVNEAIEIAKEFASPDGPTFVNGVLNKVIQRVGLKGGSGLRLE